MAKGDLDQIEVENRALVAQPSAGWSSPRLGFPFNAAAMLDRLGLALGASFEREIDAGRGFLWLPVAFGTGALFYFALPAEPLLPALLSVAIALWLAVWTSRSTVWRFRLVLVAAMLMTGTTATKFRTDLIATPMLTRPVTGTLSGFVEGRVARIGGYRLTIRVTGLDAHYAGPIPGRVTVTVRGATAPVVGDGVTMLAALRPPSGPALPGGYDFRRNAFYEGIGGTGFAYGHAGIADLGSPPFGVIIREPIERLREAIRARVAAFLPGETGRVATALIIGDAGGLSEKAQNDMRQSGLAHVLSVSGLHMVLVTGVVFWTVRALLALFPPLALRHPIKKWAAIVALLVSFFYLLISGLDVAAQRSFVMTAIASLAVIADRRAISLRNIALAGLIVLVIAPESILSASFQMSFAATLALIAGFEAVSDWQRQRPRSLGSGGRVGNSLRKAAGFVTALAATSLLGGLGSTPFALYHFQRMAPLSIVANVVASPITDFVVMPLTLLAVLLMPFGLDGWVLPLIDRGIGAMLAIAATVTAWSGDSGGAAMPSVAALLIFVLGFIWLALWKERWRFLGIVPMLIGGLLALMPARPDVIVSADARQAAFCDRAGRLVVLARKPDAFVTDIWLRADGDPRTTKGNTLGGSTACDPLGCVGMLADGRLIALALDRAAFEDDCLRAALIVTPLEAPAACAARTAVIDRVAAAKSGALTLFIRPEKGDNPASAATETGTKEADEGLVSRTDQDEDIGPATDATSTDPPAARTTRDLLQQRFVTETAYPAVRRPWMPLAQ